MSRYKHICVIYNTTEEWYDLLMPYLKEGYDQGEQLLTIVEDHEHSSYLSKLDSIGIPVTQSQKSKQLIAHKTSESYNGTSFNPDRMSAMVEQTLANAARHFTSIRTCGDMNWAAEPGVDTDAVMRYESFVNRIVPQYDCTCMCAYNASRFPGSLVLDILATHPVVVMRGHVTENPYYTSPSEFLNWMKIRDLWKQKGTSEHRMHASDYR